MMFQSILTSILTHSCFLTLLLCIDHLKATNNGEFKEDLCAYFTNILIPVKFKLLNAAIFMTKQKKESAVKMWVTGIKWRNSLASKFLGS